MSITCQVETLLRKRLQLFWGSSDDAYVCVCVCVMWLLY